MMRRNPASVNSGTRIQMRPQTTMAQQYMPPELTPPGYIPPGINVAQPYTAAIYEQQYLGSASGVGIVDEAQNPPMPNNQNFRYPYQQNRR
ncbi:MAG: hypothetical protein M1812_001864 [Candelaria pacifica]|nr:MAG: hypothetical protein M1812_001864 [Candelaria pacifica]